MPVVFVHVSDIHFGQESDHIVHIHDDVKRELVVDAATVVAALPSQSAHGILVTGDITHAGKAEEYVQAGKWLDSLAGAIGCPSHRVRMVPGNHDGDLDKLSVGGRQLLDFIRAGGAAEYEKVMSNVNDRATLFARFENYSRFSIGYDCGLDEEAKYATNLRFEVGPNRWIRIVRLNSSLLCHGKERADPPELVIGQRQFSIPRNPGEENVVLAHHPLHWYKGAEDFRHYVRSRARVFITGHEHDPKVSIDNVAVERLSTSSHGPRYCLSSTSCRTVPSRSPTSAARCGPSRAWISWFGIEATEATVALIRLGHPLENERLEGGERSRYAWKKRHSTWAVSIRSADRSRHEGDP